MSTFFFPVLIPGYPCPKCRSSSHLLFAMKAGLLTLVLCALSASALVVTPTVGRTAVCAGKLSLHAHHIPGQEASAPTP